MATVQVTTDQTNYDPSGSGNTYVIARGVQLGGTYGFFVDDNSTVIQNRGTIGGSDYAVAVNPSGASSVVYNYVGGVLGNNGLTYANTNLTVFNYGSASGDIVSLAADTTISNYGSLSIGSINPRGFGRGETVSITHHTGATLSVAAVNGTNLVINLVADDRTGANAGDLGTNQGSVGTLAAGGGATNGGSSTLNIVSGTWTLGDAEYYNRVAISTGANFNVVNNLTVASAALTNAGTLQVTARITAFMGANGAGSFLGNGTILGALTLASGGSVTLTSANGLHVGGFTGTSGSTLNDVLGGQAFHVTAGTVNLGGMTLNLQGGAALAQGQVQIIVDNQGSSAVQGSFANAANGSLITVDGNSYQISYNGGDGNDVVVTRIASVAPPPPDPNGYYVSNGIDPVTIAGGDGNDTYVVANPRTTIIERANEGNDTIYVSTEFGLTTYALNGGAFIETISAQEQRGTDPLNLTGNFYSQTLVGNNGANILNGNGGADTLIGLGGDDTYAIADASAVIVEQPGQGYDRVYTSVGYTLTGTASVEELGFTNQGGTENLNLIGNAFDQKIVGNYGDNVLNGNGGVDTLIGLLGNDIYVVGDSRTVVIENGGEGFDTVYANTSYMLAAGASIEVLSTATQGGTEAYDLTGNGFAQAVIGNNGANVIDGGAGADTLTGLGGADTFRFSTALGGGNVDAITDFGNGADRLSLASGIFTGMAQGTLSASNFVNGTAATTADQHIVYNQATGQLFFDADGSGAGAAVLFATVAPNTIITASMITVA